MPAILGSRGQRVGPLLMDRDYPEKRIADLDASEIGSGRGKPPSVGVWAWIGASLFVIFCIAGG